MKIHDLYEVYHWWKWNFNFNSLECQFQSITLTKSEWNSVQLTSENVNVDTFAIGVWWTACVLTRIRCPRSLDKQIRSRYVSLLGDNAHATSSWIIVYFLGTSSNGREIEQKNQITEIFENSISALCQIFHKTHETFSYTNIQNEHKIDWFKWKIEIICLCSTKLS